MFGSIAALTHTLVFSTWPHATSMLHRNIYLTTLEVINYSKLPTCTCTYRTCFLRVISCNNSQNITCIAQMKQWYLQKLIFKYICHHSYHIL